MQANESRSAAHQQEMDKLGQQFDNREYAKALRTADRILEKHPDDADALAMKGLTLHSMSKKEEGYECIKAALAKNFKSTVAWHCYGMCYRSDKNALEAFKCFKQANRCDPKNPNVLRDVSSAAVQLRDWENFAKAREELVQLRPGVHANWVGLSCAHRLRGNPKLAAVMLDVANSIMDPVEDPVAASEVELYRVELELECGASSKAIELLKKNDKRILDEPTKRQLRARAHSMAGQKSEAEKRYLSVIELGVEEADSIAAIARLRDIELLPDLRPKQGHEEAYVAVLDMVLEHFPKCDYARRHYLDCMPMGDGFRTKLVDFVKVYVKKMIPSLFTVLKSLYRFPDKAQVIGEVFSQWEAELEQGDFATSFGGEANPVLLLWVRTYLASHYRRIGDFDRSISYIDSAIQHTPTLELLYVEKAKTLRRQGKLTEAAEQADMARKLDLQDKYLNAKAAKYFLHDNQIEKAEETMQLFYKALVVPGETYLTALESQCYWYEKEVGEAFYRRGDYVSALQNLLMFELHHKHNHNELMDFHNYVFRRCTIRPWFNVLDNDHHMEKNKFFLRTCPALVRTYMKVDELGEAAVRAAHVPRPELDFTDVAEEEVKRLQQLLDTFVIKDIDLTEPLSKAERYLSYLLENRPHDADTHVLAAELYTRLQKPLLVARAIHNLQRIAAPQLSETVAQFKSGLYVNSAPKMDPRVKAVIDKVLANAE